MFITVKTADSEVVINLNQIVAIYPTPMGCRISMTDNLSIQCYGKTPSEVLTDIQQAPIKPA